MPLPLLAIGAGAGLLGGIFKGIGRNRERGAQRAEDARLEAETRRRAQGKAALMRGILNASGYGGMMTDAQMVDLLTRTERRGNTAGGLLGDIGGGLQGVGSSMVLGSKGADDGGKSAEFWDWLDEAMQGQRTPPTAGVPTALTSPVG